MFKSEIREEIVKGLCDIFGHKIHQIILYGSVAKNEATSESDIDIAIILDGKLTEADRELFIAFVADLDLKYDKVFSIIDIEQSTLEKWGKILPFYKSLQEEGIVLWKAA